MNRPYRSAVREQQAEDTRQRIVDAVVALLSGGETSWTIADVAERADVATRTVHRYFATRDELVDGVVEWINEVITAEREEPEVHSLDDLVAAAPGAFRFVQEHDALYRVLLSTTVGQRSHRRGRARREREMRAALQAELASIPAERAQTLLALTHLLASSHAALFLGDYWGMDADAAADAVGWALRTLVREACVADREETS